MSTFRNFVLSSLMFLSLSSMAYAGDPFVVHVNTATADELSSLPRLGEKKAMAIVQYRHDHGDFTSLEGLSEIKGISSTMIDQWSDTLVL